MTTVVIDVGAATHEDGDESSALVLLKRFEPLLYMGFDPALSPERRDRVFSDLGILTRRRYEEERSGGARIIDWAFRWGQTTGVLSSSAGWVYDGIVNFDAGGSTGKVSPDGSPTGATDLLRIIRSVDGEKSVVLKLDAEGAEYVILPKIISEGLAPKLERLLVEWHCRECGRGGGHRPGCPDDPHLGGPNHWGREAAALRRLLQEAGVEYYRIEEWDR